MSYILDALRKSEQERQRGQVPDLSSYQGTQEPETARNNIWPWVAGLAVVINLVVILVVWAPWRAKPQVVAITPDRAAQTASGSPPSATAPQPTLRTPAPTTQQQAQTPGQPTQLAQTAPPTKPVQQSSASEPVPTTVVDATRAPIAKPILIRPNKSDTEPSTQPDAPVPQVAYMPQLDELPAAERKDVPDMTFSSHMYSSIPRFRSVIINGKRLKEGDYLTPKIQLREITDNGVIMSDGKTLFSVDVLGRWAQ